MSDFNRWLILYIILNIKSKKYIESNNVFIVCINKSTEHPKNPPKWFYFVCDIKEVCYLGPTLRFRQGSWENSPQSWPQYASSSQHTSCSCADKLNLTARGAHSFFSASAFSRASNALLAAEFPRFLALRYHSFALFRSFSMPIPSS